MIYTLYDDRGIIVDSKDDLKVLCEAHDIPYFDTLMGMKRADNEHSYNRYLIVGSGDNDRVARVA